MKPKHLFVLDYFVALSLAAMLSMCSLAQAPVTPTVVTVSNTVQLSGAKKFGLNLGTQTYWDSGLMLKNLVSRNPGFEGETWQSILHCGQASTSSCTDDNVYSVWPAAFFAGATAEFMTGNLTGTSVAVITSTAASSSASKGVSISFAPVSTAPAAGSYLVVRMNVPGNAQAGWWTQAAGGGTVGTELVDLSPSSPGLQAARLSATSTGQVAGVTSYLDTTPGFSFLQLHGMYSLSFRARGAGGANAVKVDFQRLPVGGTNLKFFSQTVSLGSSWQDYNFVFAATDGGGIGPLSLSFSAAGSSVLLDDVSLSEMPGNSTNGTAFRDDVVNTLQSVKPGILRYMDSGTNWGSSIDNLLAVPFARKRTGYSNFKTLSEDVPIGLHEFLQLCEQVGAEPWFTLPTGMTTAEATNLMEYLGGSTSTAYGSRRAALGHPAAWTTTFPRIHLEFGNEVWNTANPGATMVNPVGYAQRATAIFTTLRASSWYAAPNFDLVADGWAAVSTWNQQVLANASKFDTIDVAPYLFYSFRDASSNEAIFGPMFAQPELFDSTAGGQMQTAAALASQSGVKLSVYEVNLSTNAGTVSQSAVNSAVPSLGAGLATIDHMLLMLRDLGVTEQSLFALPGHHAVFSNTSNASLATTSPIWGGVLDMGNTLRKRPNLTALALANTAILPKLWATSQTGANPTWNQAKSANDNIQLANAHYIQSFAFTDGTKGSLILLNLHRSTALPVTLTGVRSPSGTINVATLTSAAITDNNEDASRVAVSESTTSLQTGQVISLPPYSMTVLRWTVPAVRMTAVTCTASTLVLLDSTTCSSDIVSSDSLGNAVTWSASAGTIDATGHYQAPSVMPASGTVTITATSQKDPTQAASFTLSVIPSPVVYSVTISCSSSTVPVSTQMSCTATTDGIGKYDRTILFSTTAGTISSSGVILAPTTIGQMVVTAASAYNPAVKSSATIAVVGQAVGITSLLATNLTPTSVTVSWNAGYPNSNNGVNYGKTTAYGSTTPWSSLVTANPSYTLSSLSPNTTYYLQVYTVAQGKMVAAKMTIQTPTIVGGSASCDTPSLTAGGHATCTVALSDGSAVVWSATAGSISAAGVYTAPATISTNQTVSVTAIRASDTTKSTSTTIALVSDRVTGVSVSCAPNTILTSGTTSCSAAVVGSGNYSGQVVWSAGSGSIDAKGTYTGPATAGAVSITATSVQTPAVSGTTSVTVTQPASPQPPATQPPPATQLTLGVSNLMVSGITGSTVKVSWNCGVPSTSGLSYGTSKSFGKTTPYNAALSTTPQITLSGLLPGTHYYLLVYSKSSGRTVTATIDFSTAGS